MLGFDHNIFKLHRGDSFELPIYINLGEDRFHLDRYTLGKGDKLYVSIAEPNQPWERSLIKKVYTCEDVNELGDVVLKLGPKDTEFVMPGKYYLEAKLLLESGDVYTIFPKHQFWIVE